MAALKPFAEWARAHRTPVGPDNPFLALEKNAALLITTALQCWGELRDAMTEAVFLNTYGSPLVQAMVGLRAGEEAPRRIERDLVRETAAAKVRAGLDDKFDKGGLEEAALRALVYVRMPGEAFDERGFRMLKLIRDQRKSNDRITPAAFRDMLDTQLKLVRLDAERALKAIPKLLKGDEKDLPAVWSALQKILAAPGALDADGERRRVRVEKLFEANKREAAARR